MTVQPTLTFTDIVDGEPVEAATWIPIHDSIKSHANVHTHDEYTRWVKFTGPGQSFQRYDITRDGEWTMVANKATSARPAPQPSGDQIDLLPDWSPSRNNNRASYTVANEWMTNAAGWVSAYGVEIEPENQGASHVVVFQVNGVTIDTITFTPHSAGIVWIEIPPGALATNALLRVSCQVTQVSNNQMFWSEQAGLFSTPPPDCSLAQGQKDGGVKGTTAYGCHVMFTPGVASPDWDLLSFSGQSGGAGGTDLTTVPLLAPENDLRNTFSGPSGRLVITGKVTGDANNRLQIDSTGKLSWGDGTIAPDVNLYRSAATTIRTDQAFTVGTNLSVLGVTTLSGFTSITRSVPASCLEIKGTGDAQPRLAFVNSPRIDFGSGSAVADVSLSRSAAGQLTFGSSTQKVGLQVFGSVAGDSSFQTRVTTDAQPRFVLGADGKLFWSDGTLAADTSLARTGVAQLSLTGALVATGAITTSLTVSASAFTATGAANQFKAQAVGSVGSGVLLIRLTADVNDRFQIWGDGTHTWGPGTGATDTTLYRLNSVNLATSGGLYLGVTTQGILTLGADGYISARLGSAVGSATFVSRLASGDTVDRFRINNDGSHAWGPGNAPADCSLGRNGANELRLADTTLSSMRTSNVANAILLGATGDGFYRLSITANGNMGWGPGNTSADTTLYRRGAKELGLNDSFLTVQRTNATDIAYRSLLLAGDSFARFQIDASGTQAWGPGNAATDTTLTRTAVGVLALGTQTQAARLRLFAGSTGAVAYDATVAAEALPRFYISGAGAHFWGDGTLTQDCQLFRNSAGELRTADTFLAIVRGSTVSTAFSAHATGDGQRRFLIDARGQQYWGDGTNPTDTVLQRRGAKEIGLVDTFLTVTRTNATDIAYRSLLTTGDTVARLQIDTNGSHTWGPGNAAADVTLARNSPGYMLWTLTSGFEVSGGGYFLARGPNFYSGLMLQGSTALSALSPRILFRDTQATVKSLYIGKTADQTFAIIDDGGNQRVSFDVGGTNRPTILPGSLNVGGDGVSQGVISLGINGYVSARAAAGAGSATFVSRVTGDAQDRFNLYASGQMNWGDGTSATLDAVLRRRGPGDLATLDTLFTSQRAAAANSALATLITGETQYRLIVRADGLLQWSDGTAVGDTFLSRIGDATHQGLAVASTRTLAAGAADSAVLQIAPTVNGAFTLTRLNYIEAKQPAGSSTITDAAVVSFDAVPGTHKAVDAGTTKTTPGTVSAWVKVNINGTIYYMPAYTSKTT